MLGAKIWISLSSLEYSGLPLDITHKLPSHIWVSLNINITHLMWISLTGLEITLALQVLDICQASCWLRCTFFKYLPQLFTEVEVNYYSTLAPFYHIRSRERINMPRYYTVKLCIALQNPGFTKF